jgi:hypothetical protein
VGLKDGVFIDPGGVHEGVEKINAIVELLFTQFEGYVFSVRGPGQSMHGVGRLPWSYGPPDDPKRLTGTDLGVTKDGKLTALYVFIDPPSQKQVRSRVFRRRQAEKETADALVFIAFSLPTMFSLPCGRPVTPQSRSSSRRDGNEILT